MALLIFYVKISQLMLASHSLRCTVHDFADATQLSLANVLSKKARRLNKNNLIYLLTFKIYAAGF